MCVCVCECERECVCPGFGTGFHSSSLTPHISVMQPSRTSSSIGVFADCSITAGARLGPVPGIFRLGKCVSDRKEVGVKKKVSVYLIKEDIPALNRLIIIIIIIV